MQKTPPQKQKRQSSISISGRLKNGLGVGVFNGLTAQQQGTAINTDDDSERAITISPISNYNVFVLDGDNLRAGINRGLGFTTEDRTENIRRTAEVAKLFSDAGFIVIVSLISPYRSERKKARDIRPEYFREIYIKASLEECIKRDVKGLYAKAIKSEIKDFTGISSPYEAPTNPDLIIDTENENIEKSVLKLESYISSEFSIKNCWQILWSY